MRAAAIIADAVPAILRSRHRVSLEAAAWIEHYPAPVLAPHVILIVGSVPPGRGFWRDPSMGPGFAAIAMFGVRRTPTARFKRASASHFLCRPPPLTKAAEETLRAFGVPAHRIHTEVFALVQDRRVRRSAVPWPAISTGALMILCAALFAWVQTPERDGRSPDAVGRQSGTAGPAPAFDLCSAVPADGDNLTFRTEPAG